MAGSTTASPSQTYTLTLANDITVASNGPAGSSSFANGGSTITFDVTITNPCFATTIPSLTFNPSSTMQVTDGSSGSVEFARPVNPIETSTGVSLICGRYVFEVYQDSSDTALSSAWVYIQEKSSSPGTYEFWADTTVDTSLITTQSSQTYTIYVKSYLEDYTDVKTYTTWDVQVNAASCDCTALLWDAPTIATPSVAVNIGSAETIPVPVANTSNRSTNAGFDYCYASNSEAADSCDLGGTFGAGSITYDDGVTSGGTTLPSWITFSSSGSSTQTVQIDPPDGSYMSQTHTLFATYTSTYGPDLTYTAMTITVICTITNYDMPTTPAEPTFDLSYIVFAAPMVIDLSTLAYTEQPTCNYEFTEAITWTGLTSSFMTQDSNNASLISISTSDKSIANSSPYALTYQRALTVTSSGQSGTTVFRNTGSDILSFSVTVTDPCVAATTNDPTLSSVSMQNGGSQTITFTEATNSVDDGNTVAGLCGDINYSVVDANTGTPSAISWITVSKDLTGVDTHTITLSPDDQSLVTGSTLGYYLAITYAEYSSKAAHYTSFPV